MIVSSLDIIQPSASRLSASQLRDVISHSLDEDKAEDIAIIDLAGKCDFADYMVVASGRSQRHVSAIASKLNETLKASGRPPLSVEGMESGEWVLLDAGDVIVHLFHPEKREYYNIEKMWEVPMPVMLANKNNSPELHV